MRNIDPLPSAYDATVAVVLTELEALTALEAGARGLRTIDVEDAAARIDPLLDAAIADETTDWREIALELRSIAEDTAGSPIEKVQCKEALEVLLHVVAAVAVACIRRVQLDKFRGIGNAS